jgi:hypothetical protein
MVLILMLVWVAAAVLLWKRASTEGAADYWRWAAVAVAMPLIMSMVGREVSKRMDRTR